jgi:hypothetical protein
MATNLVRLSVAEVPLPQEMEEVLVMLQVMTHPYLKAVAVAVVLLIQETLLFPHAEVTVVAVVL